MNRQLRRWVSAGESFSLIFADPPYGAAAQELLSDESLPQLLGDGGPFVFESAKRETITAGKSWEAAREAIYGDTRVSFLKAK